MSIYRKLSVHLKPSDKKRLRKSLRGGIRPVREVRRARTLLLLDDGVAVAGVAYSVGLSLPAVRNIGWRYCEGGLQRALHDLPRPGAQPVLDEAARQRVIAMVCSDAPEGHSRWTVRLIAEEAVKRKLVNKVGRETIRLLLLHHDFKPWREKNVVHRGTQRRVHRQNGRCTGIYERPYNPAEPVVCVDEKPVSLHAEVRPPEPAQPGSIAKRDGEYERCGTANVFCAVEPKAGKHFTWPTPNRSALEFAQVLAQLSDHYAEADTIHLVMDNLNIHCCKSLTKRYGAEIGQAIWDRFTVHYTPKHGSWLNQAEIEISLFARQCLGRRRIPDLATLKRQAKAWNRGINRKRTPIKWTFDRKSARRKFGYKRQRSSRS